MKRVEFRPGDLSEQAFDEYSNNSLQFYKGKDNLYYIESIGYELVGTITDVEGLLTSYFE